jgi:hypothetical protein
MFIFLAMASPAASSFALLILYPLESLNVDADSRSSLLFNAFFAINDDIL